MAATSQPAERGHRISVVVPLHNEEASVATLVAQIAAVLEPEWDLEIILVDDGSSDSTWTRIQEAQRAEPRVRGLSFARNFGKEAAIVAGIQHADGDAVIVMDGDLQHPPSILPDMIARWREGAEVVAAVKRTRPGQSLPVRAGARAFNRTFSRLTGVDLTEATDLRLLSRPAVAALLELPERTLFFRGMSTWIGFPAAQVEFDVAERSQGNSRYTLMSLGRFAVRSLTAFTSTPLHLVTVVGIGFAVLSVLLGVQTLIRWLQGAAVEGFTTVILLLLILGSAMLLGLGIIGEYLARIHEEVKARPRYIIADQTVDQGGER